MPQTGFAHGPFYLTEANLNAALPYSGPGSYVLGYVAQNKFVVQYAGRADTDVTRRLKDHVGKYMVFQAGYWTTAQQAFEHECYLYHAFGGPQGLLNNQVHPAKPAGMLPARCPICLL